MKNWKIIRNIIYKIIPAGEWGVYELQLYNYIDLFHGIGGFALGAYWAGMKFKNHFCSDIEKYCIDLYKLRFPDSIQLGDIKQIDCEDLKKYGNKWIITGGFPCQDISIAGKGEGITGSRSGLWFEYWRIIRDLRPKFAIMENVSALSFRGLDTVLGSLAEIGYNAEWQDIRASDMGAPHKRERLWIIVSDSNKQYGDLCRFYSSEISQFQTSELSGSKENVSNTESERQRRGEMSSHIGNKSKNKQIWKKSRCKVIQHNWSEEFKPELSRMANGLPEELDRLKGLGNSIVPQIAELLFRQIKDLL